jgi:hypothetical protein
MPANGPKRTSHFALLMSAFEIIADIDYGYFAPDRDLADRVRAFAASNFESIQVGLRQLISLGLSAPGAKW